MSREKRGSIRVSATFGHVPGDQPAFSGSVDGLLNFPKQTFSVCMSRRDRPFVAKPSAAARARLAAAASARLFVVQEPGPTSFVLKAPLDERSACRCRCLRGLCGTCGNSICCSSRRWSDALPA